MNRRGLPAPPMLASIDSSLSHVAWSMSTMGSSGAVSVQVAWEGVGTCWWVRNALDIDGTDNARDGCSVTQAIQFNEWSSSRRPLHADLFVWVAGLCAAAMGASG